MAKKKKQSSIRRIISALNPTNPKGMALLFVLIFALSGAGVYAYRSFASTLTFCCSGISGSNGASLISESQSGKSNLNVWKMPVTDSKLEVSFSAPGGITHYKPCINARSTGSGSATASISIGITGLGTGENVTVPVSSAYGKICLSGEFTMSSSGQVGVQVTNEGSIPFNVGSIVVE